jgi:hypothetical protein
MPSTDPRYTTGRLAALADLGIGLPIKVTRAIAAFRAAEQIQVPAPPRPGVLTRQAAITEAGRLARQAAESARPSFDLSDVSAVAAARAEEQAAADRQVLAQEVRDAAALVLAEAVAQSRGEVITAIQAKHRSIVADLCKRARRLPPGASEQTALETGGQHRADFLAARDAVAELARLREAIRPVDAGTPLEPDDGLSFCSAWERTGRLAGTWLAPAGVTTHGPPGSLEFYLSAARVPDYELWLPTAAEQAARLAELRADRQAQRARAAAL